MESKAETLMNNENEGGNGGEVIEGVDHMFNKGKFNQKNQEQDKKDRSNEEPNSSFSSSEEALESCEGAVVNEQLLGSPKCNENATLSEIQASNISTIIGPYEVDS